MDNDIRIDDLEFIRQCRVLFEDIGFPQLVVGEHQIVMVKRYRHFLREKFREVGFFFSHMFLSVSTEIENEKLISTAKKVLIKGKGTENG